MSCRVFIEPSFIAEVTNPNETPARRMTRLEHGASHIEVDSRLKAEGLEVHSVTQYDFNEWKARAAAATQKVLVDYPAARAADEPFEFKSELWREVKDYLFRLFENRCAYCEADTRVVGPGDVEHYRPKARVEEDRSHPGYYWLAYDITNYLPACTDCNAARGKRNHFPLGNPQKRVVSPGADLSDEEPLLINPLQHSISDEIHFEFRLAGEVPVCLAVPRSNASRGSTSVATYNLNRGQVLEKRGRECARALSDVFAVLATLGRSQALQVFESSLRKRQFPTACAEIVMDHTKGM